MIADDYRQWSRPSAVPRYRMAAIAPLPATPAAEREKAAADAGWNVSLLPSSRVDFDLRTDSAASPQLDQQLAAFAEDRGRAEDPATHAALVEEIGSLVGKQHVVLFAQGRAAEAVVADVLPWDGATVATNGIFPSTRFHLARARASIIDCVGLRQSGNAPSADSDGDIDLERAASVLGDAAGRKAVWLELACNGVFGQPVTLGGLDRAATFARRIGASFGIDATRCLENAALLRARDARARDSSVRGLVAALCAPARVVTASCLKSFHARLGGFAATDDDAIAEALEDAALARGDGMAGAACEMLRLGIRFASSDEQADSRIHQPALLHDLLSKAGLPVLGRECGHAVYLDAGGFLPHLQEGENPAKALALALYLDSGIRIDEHWLPEALWASGLSAVRIALPARTYLDEQVAWIASRIIAVHERRREVLGLFRLPTGTGLSRSLRARFRRARGTP